MKEFRLLAASPKERPYTPLECEDMKPMPSFTIMSATRREFLEMMSENEINIPKSAIKKAADIDGDGEEGAAAILAEMGEDNIWKTVLGSHTFNMDILKKKLKGWKNVPDVSGSDLPYSEENIEFLSDELVTDLVREITGQPRPEEEKKSEKESSSSSGSETAAAGTSGTAHSANPKSSNEPETAKEDTTEKPE
jgi:hypothetical protein